MCFSRGEDLLCVHFPAWTALCWVGGVLCSVGRSSQQGQALGAEHSETMMLHVEAEESCLKEGGEKRNHGEFKKEMDVFNASRMALCGTITKKLFS